MLRRFWGITAVAVLLFNLSACADINIPFELKAFTAQVTIKNTATEIKGELTYNSPEDITFKVRSPENIRGMTFRSVSQSMSVSVGEVSFTADEKRDMGSVNVVPLGTKSRVKLSLEISNHNWKVAWIVNGERVRLDATTRMGYNGEFELTTSKKIDFVRAEVYDYFGTLLCMTNPIYFTSELKNIKNNIDGRAVNR